MYFNTIKAIYEKPTINIPKLGKLKAFSLASRTTSRERASSSISSSKKMISQGEECSRPLAYTMHKNYLRMDRGLNVRTETMELLEENIKAP